MPSKIISYSTYLSIPQFDAVTTALYKTAKVNSRITFFPEYAPSSSCDFILQIGVVNTSLLFERNQLANGESDLVFCKLLAPDKKAYKEARFLLEALGPSDALLTEEINDR